MRVRKTESGILFVEFEDTVRAERRVNQIAGAGEPREKTQCAHCGSTEKRDISRAAPSCGHSDFFVCDHCRVNGKGCQVCGCREELTIECIETRDNFKASTVKTTAVK